MGSLRPYIQIARIDHWFKNAFMLLGLVLAWFYRPDLFRWDVVPTVALALLATCLVASSNYVVNEWLDAEKDRHHPTKKDRPAAQGLVKGWAVLLEWGLLGVGGVLLGVSLNPWFGLSAAALWIMGCLYNLPPIRTKEIPYIDVLSESVNNPIRLLLGWYALITDRFPPVSLLLAYWMIAAFMMATKRFAEYRRIGDKEAAANYRSSFRYYDDSRLLVSMTFYATACSFFAGIFIVRYKLELILSVPFVAGFLAMYLRLGLQEDSPVQHPEKLYKQTGFLLFAILTVVVFVFLMFVQIPALYDLFNVEPSDIEPLWQIGDE